MDEQILEDFLLDKIGSGELVQRVFGAPNYKEGNFAITRGHLLKLCDLAIEKKITAGLLESISDYLEFSEYFAWDTETKDGGIIEEIVFEWGSPTINYEINNLNLNLWKEYLLTGENKLPSHNFWNSHIQKQKEICEKAKATWKPVNPKHKIGISGNLDAQPVHGLRHPAEKGTTGWFIWTGEYSTNDNFFKPIHAGHLLEERPELIKYLGLPPGYRFLIDNNGHEDIWEDQELLKVSSKQANPD